MIVLALKAYFRLMYFDFYLIRGKFNALHNRVRNCPIVNQQSSPKAVAQICAAVDLACIWYWKEALCLQRSAATVYLLKRSGISAQLVIGAQQMPFRAHAWVEVDEQVVNDKPYVPDIYAVLEKC